MKHFFHLFLFVLAGFLWLMPQKAQAYGNDYLEQGYHYQVYTAGPDKIHFKIPVWSYGKVNDYVALPTSRFSYKVAGLQDVEVANWCAAAQMDNTEENDRGTVAMKLNNNQGEILVTSLCTGVKYSVRSGGMWSEWLTVIQREEEGCKHVTWLEFDWYPPESLENTSFSIKVYAKLMTKGWIISDLFGDDRKDISKYYRYDKPVYDLSWTYDGPFKGNNNSLTPQLNSPFLYQLNEKGMTGYGYAAVSYALYDAPVSYTTSYDATVVKLKQDERAGMIYVMTNDTVQTNFYADFGF